MWDRHTIESRDAGHDIKLGKAPNAINKLTYTPRPRGNMHAYML